MNTDPGSKAAWVAEALRQFERPLLRYAAGITGDTEQARDVVQETFLKLCAADRASVEGHLAAWLHTVVRNHALNVRKKESRMAPLLDAYDAFPAPGDWDPGVAAERNEKYRLVADSIRELPPDQQEVCRLRFHNGLTYREISEVMGVSLGTVSNLIAGALDVMRRRLRAGEAPAREA